MKLASYALALPLLAAMPLAAPAAAAEVQMSVQNPVVELGVTEIVKAEPDVAQIGAGVMTRAPSASEAVRQNAQAMERLVARLRALGIERKDIQTSNFSLNAQYDYNRDGVPPTFIGYDVNNQVNVKLRRMDKVGETLDALVAAGANNIYGPNFTLEDDVEAKAVARKNAFQRGRLQAEEFARMAGYTGVRLLEVSENFQSYGPMPSPPPMAVTVSAAKADVATPIESGEVGVGVTLSVKYEMTR
ncbi:MAG: SIMPL domain-containing protein [Novosphingobium sp.]|nr:SIMPL domain-containing protein [Novosphingobium sp.]